MADKKDRLPEVLRELSHIIIEAANKVRKVADAYERGDEHLRK